MKILRSAFRSTLRAASAAALLGACQDFALAPAPPQLPAGAEPFATPETYASWWRETEQCAGQFASFTRVSWFVVPGRTSFIYRDGQYDGYWWSGVHWILLAGDKIENAMIVRHEMLHDLLGTGKHPAEYFQQRCGNIVHCNETCRADG